MTETFSYRVHEGIKHQELNKKGIILFIYLRVTDLEYPGAVTGAAVKFR